MSSSYFDSSSEYVFDLSSGSFDENGGYSGVRPSISLKYDVEVASGGDGTRTNPYEFVVK